MPPGNATNNCAQTAASPTACGGFTVAAENPVYVQGNYNSNCPANASGAGCARLGLRRMIRPGTALRSEPLTRLLYHCRCCDIALQPTACGGFTVAAENPVYVQGNWLEFELSGECRRWGVHAWAGGTYVIRPGTALREREPPPRGGFDYCRCGHHALEQLARCGYFDGLTWQAGNQTNGSLENPINPAGQGTPAATPNRIAVNTYYRVAIAGGKPIAFLNTAQNPEFAFRYGAGGVHNFPAVP